MFVTSTGALGRFYPMPWMGRYGVAFGRSKAVDKEAQAFLDEVGAQYEETEPPWHRARWFLDMGGARTRERQHGERQKAYEKRMAARRERLQKEARRLGQAYGKLCWSAEHRKKLARLLKSRIRSPFIRRQLKLWQPIFKDANPDFYGAITEEQKWEGIATRLFDTHQMTYEGNTLTRNQAMARWLESTDPVEAKGLWLAMTNVASQRTEMGMPLSSVFIRLVKARQAYAKLHGYDNYYQFKLAGAGIPEPLFQRMLTEIDEATRPAQQKLRKRLDKGIQDRYGVTESQARRPWFVGFKQIEAALGLDMDGTFKGKDPRKLVRETARRMGVSVDTILSRSDVFDAPGKIKGAYTYGVDPPHEVRVTCQFDRDLKTGMFRAVGTLCHETLGHALGFQHIDPTLPVKLRYTHNIMGESDSFLMEELRYDPVWLREVAQLPEDVVEIIATQGKQLARASELYGKIRCTLARTAFEYALYRLPEEKLTVPRLNKLWVDTVKRYEGITFPKGWNKPTWLSNRLLITHPAYEPNYLLAIAVKAQVKAYLDKRKHYYGGLMSKRTGRYFKSHRRHGLTHPWPTIVKQMTGESLSAKALKAEYDTMVLPDV